MDTNRAPISNQNRQSSPLCSGDENTFTRGRLAGDPTIIDLLLSSLEIMIFNLEPTLQAFRAMPRAADANLIAEDTDGGSEAQIKIEKPGHVDYLERDSILSDSYRFRANATDINGVELVEAQEASFPMTGEGARAQSSPKSLPSLCDHCIQGASLPGLAKDPYWITTALASPHNKYTGSDAFFHASDKGKVRYRFHYTITSLEESASSGCSWCQLILFLLRDREDRELIEAVDVVLDFYSLAEEDSYGLSNGQQWKVTFSVKHDDLKVMMSNIRLRRGLNMPSPRFLIPYTTADDPLAPFVAARNRILDVNSRIALQQISQCVEDCANNHGSLGCQSGPPIPTTLPTRVVDCSDPDHPRLVKTNGATGVYLTLSYVWGEDQPHKTTTKNISSYVSGIDASLLPQTIRDAISITHSLGMQYLWADTLCIIQDSPEDKSREIARMAGIYTNAYLTIIAASASKVREGFLQKRPPPEDRYVAVRCPGTDRLGKLYFWQPTWKAVPEPIDTRAWCFQERLLSTRALIFSSTTVEYQCKKGLISIGNSILRESASPDQLSSLLFPPLNPNAPLSHQAERSLHDTWFRALGRYSQLAMTDPGDKLIAVAAVAERFGETFQSEYLAGLWRRTLMEDLLWSVDSKALKLRPANWRAPSWSWAAVDGKVEPWSTPSNVDASDLVLRNMLIEPVVQLDRFPAIAEVVRCDVALQNEEHSFGAVAGGILILRAPIFKANARRFADPRTGHPHMGVLIMRDDGYQLTLPDHAGLGKPDCIEDSYISELCVALLRVEMDHTGRRDVETNDSQGQSLCRAYGLMLFRTDAESGKKQYRRIGMIHVRLSSEHIAEANTSDLEII